MHWAARFYRQAIRHLRPTVRRRKPRNSLRIESLEVRVVPHVTGTVFIDLNQDGVQDPEDLGVAGVVVQSTDDTGATAQTTTDADGVYTLETDAEALRLEFSSFPDGTVPGRAVGTSGPAVRFLTASSDRLTQNLSLASPMLVTTQFFYDRATDGANADQGAVLALPYGVQDTATPTVLATVADVGSVWGVAYQPSSNSVYVSSFLKRHAGLGPNATGTGTTSGGIYRIDRSGDTPVTSLLIDLNAAGAAFLTGDDPQPTTPESESGDAWFHDAATIPLVGKRGLGGLQTSADGRTLYTVNLNTRELIEIPLNVDGTRDTSHPLRGTPIPLTNPTGSGITAFNSANLRPFAVAVKDGLVYVGVTYTAETGGTAADLRAFAYAFNPTTGTFNSTPVLTANLSYTRGAADDPTPGVPGDEVSANWQPWTSTFDTSAGSDVSLVHPQPWLTDIVFDGDAMVLALRDRFGDQGGFQTGGATAGDDTPFSAIAVGDILAAAPNGSGGWQLESGGAAGGVSTGGSAAGQGPGGGEFYFQDAADPTPQEIGTGGLAQVPGFRTVAATGNDPLAAFSGGVYTFFNSDTDPSPATNTAGTAASRGEVYSTFDLNTFGSANGLGGLEAVPAVATVQAGDRLFVDTNANGLQDAGEVGISGVVVHVFQGATDVDSVTTGAGGDFLFDNLKPNTAYQIRIDTTQSALGGRALAQANRGSDDAIDSDAILNGTTAQIDFTTKADGSSILSLDGGFVGILGTGNLTLGNTVFRDANNNGTLDTGETGVPGVAVELLDETGATVLATTTTDASGVYTFATLDPLKYQVRLAASNFTGTGALVGFTASGTSSSTPDDDLDNDNNGAVSGTLGSGGFIISPLITLADGTEPINDGDNDANTNLTLDFGVVAPATAGLTLGNLVWSDTNNNGIRDTGEAGINGVSVQLFDSTGAVVQSTTTSGGGFYTFTNLTARDYRVRLAEANFQTGGALLNFTSSTTTSPDPDDDVDSNDDGNLSGTLGQANGFIESGLITLAMGAEPINDGDNDANTNLTLDFGVVPPATGPLTLGDRVFRDANNNAKLDTGELGLSGVTVELYNPAGTIIRTTTTDATGTYSFANLPAGDYRVRLAATNFQTGGALFGFTSSTATSSDPDDDVNSNDDGAPSGTLGSGGFIESGLITLTAAGEPTNDGDFNNNTNLTLDFGLVAPNLTLTLGNTVWNDVNNNGHLDSGESGIAGVSVQLRNAAGTVVQMATTNASGQYTFTGLAAGDYRVRLPASNFTGTGPLVGFTSSTGTNGATSGAFEGAGTPDPDNNTDNDDNGNVSGSLGGTGFIESGLITLSQNTEPINDGDADPNTNLTLDLGVFRKFSIGNLVFNDLNNNGSRDTGEPGIPNVTVRLLNADLSFALVGTVTTDAQGLYLFTNLVPGNYAVDVAASNFNAGGSLSSFQSSTGLNNAFEPAPSTATDNQDHGSTTGPLGSGGSVQSQTIVLGPGMPTGESPNNDATTPDNQSNLSIDFGVFQQVPASAGISGRVFLDFNNSGTFNSPDTGMQGVVLTLSGGNLSVPMTVQTDIQGNFVLTNLAAGTYTLTETQPTSPANQSGKTTAGTAGGSTATANTVSNIVLAANQQATGYTFAEIPLLSTGGTVYEDRNGNGQKDAGEPGISGVIITLTGTSVVNGTIQSRSALTDTSGNYTFDNLTPGTYNLAETQPAAFVDGKEQNGTPAAATVTNDKFAGIHLTSTATSGGFNFGEVKGASIAGVVYDDVNDDGAQATTGETGIAGATVKLAGTNDLGQAVSRTATTAADGTYSFTGLRPGTYSVIETQPAGYRDGKETAGTSAGNATAVNDRITSIALTSGATATGYLFGEHATADMVVTVTPASTTVAPGGNVTLTFTVRNKGTALASAVEVTVNFGGLTFVSSPASNFDSTTKKWTVGDVAAGATQTIQITFKAPTAGTFGPSAHVTTTSTELSTTNNSGSSVVNAGTAPPPPPSTPLGSLWFLSSSTNARKIPR